MNPEINKESEVNVVTPGGESLNKITPPPIAPLEIIQTSTPIPKKPNGSVFILIIIILLILFVGATAFAYIKKMGPFNNIQNNQVNNIEATTSVNDKYTQVNNSENQNIQDKPDNTVVSTTSVDRSKEAIIEDANKAKDQLNKSAGKKIITEVRVGTDSVGNVAPELIVDPKVMTEVSLSRVDQNAYARQLLNLQITTMLGTFETQALMYFSKNGSYSGVCDNSKELLTSQTGVNLHSDDEMSVELYKQTGITIDSYKINQSVCKSNNLSYVLTIPIPLKDGTDGTSCVSKRIGTASPVIIGQADFNTLTCIKK